MPPADPRRRRFLPARGELPAIAASAALFALAFPPFPLVLPALLAPVPIAVVIARAAERGESPWRGVTLGFWFALLAYGASLPWIVVAFSAISVAAGVAAYVATVALHGLVFGAVAGATLHAGRRATRWPLAVLLPVAWVAWEFVAARFGDIRFPWLPLALAATPLPPLVQLAELGGPSLVSAWMACVAGLVADAWLLRARRGAAIGRLGGAVAVVALVAAAGAARMRAVTLVPLARVGVVQPNVPQADKLSPGRETHWVGVAAAMTRAIGRGGRVDAVVWPEAMLDGFVEQFPDWRDSLRVAARSVGAPLIFGGPDLERRADATVLFNAAMATDAAGELGGAVAYRKRHLVPVMEAVPFVGWLFSGGVLGGFERGAEPRPFALPFGRVGAMICFESIFPQVTRAHRAAGADLLVALTNDGWLGRGLGPAQHAAHLTLRAVEARAPAIQAANSGYSVYVDPLGRSHGRTALFEAASPTYVVSTTHSLPPFVVVGDAVGWAAAAAAGGLLLRSLARRPRSSLPSSTR